ncbi:MAG: hypothetical protein QOJ39_2475 [Candidatus Eremiobacteraeota bacterium]|jgi:hypothetical protein|nr:hypothetical protein [Candidatus Eremiobacteraeota bacterium]
MLMILPLVLALAAVEPVPAASSTPRPTPLTEIGRVKALPACVPIVAHANGAITQALDNDRTLAVISTNLHNTDFDKLNFLQRRNAIEALMKQAEIMRINSSAGDAEVKKLREYAVNSPDPKRKEELKTFADALGGALYRQKKAAVEFMRDITVMRGREDAQEARDIMKRDNQTPPYLAAAQQTVQQQAGVLPTPSPFYNKQLQQMGDTMDGLNAGIQADEGRAADHSIAATSGC